MNSRQLFLAHLAQTTDFPLSIEVEKAAGVYLYGPNGERYMDLISGIGVSNVGHRHPKVVEAIHQQQVLATGEAAVDWRAMAMGGFLNKYAGRVAAIADGAREGGLVL